MSHGNVEIVDVQGDVVPPDVAVARHFGPLVGCRVVEHLEHRLVPAPEEAVLRDGRPRVHVEVLRHPVAVVAERSERIEVVAAEHVDEEGRGLVEVGNGEPHVVETAQPGQAHDQSPYPASGSRMI
jgi:hypothetical protein